LQMWHTCGITLNNSLQQSSLESHRKRHTVIGEGLIVNLWPYGITQLCCIGGHGKLGPSFFSGHLLSPLGLSWPQRIEEKLPKTQ
jgi:hypothetical protein